MWVASFQCGSEPLILTTGSFCEKHSHGTQRAWENQRWVRCSSLRYTTYLHQFLHDASPDQSESTQTITFNFLLYGISYLYDFNLSRELPWWLSGKESTCQCRRHGFSPSVGKIRWRRAWQPTPVFLPGKSHGQRSLAGYSPWGHKGSDPTTKQQQSCKRGRTGRVTVWDPVCLSWDLSPFAHYFYKLGLVLSPLRASLSSTIKWEQWQYILCRLVTMIKAIYLKP